MRDKFFVSLQIILCIAFHGHLNIQKCNRTKENDVFQERKTEVITMNEKKLMAMKTQREYDRLLADVGKTLEQGRIKAVAAVNSAMVQTYWEIGRQIVEYEQHGNEKAEYGLDILNRLSHDLTERYGKGFSHSNVIYMRRLYLTYPKSQTLSDFLSWSHYIELLKINDPFELLSMKNNVNWNAGEFAN